MIIMQVKNAIISIHAVALLLTSFCLLILLLGSGHRINFGDFGQVKLLLEILIIFMTAGALFFKRKGFLFSSTVVIVLLILVQLSFIDFYLEASDVEYGDSKPVIVFVLFFLLFISNFFLICSQLRSRKTIIN